MTCDLCSRPAFFHWWPVKTCRNHTVTYFTAHAEMLGLTRGGNR